MTPLSPSGFLGRLPKRLRARGRRLRDTAERGVSKGLVGAAGPLALGAGTYAFVNQEGPSFTDTGIAKGAPGSPSASPYQLTQRLKPF